MRMHQTEAPLSFSSRHHSVLEAFVLSFFPIHTADLSAKESARARVFLLQSLTSEVMNVGYISDDDRSGKLHMIHLLIQTVEVLK